MTMMLLSRGRRVWYRRIGAGAPLFQIHGSALGHRNFDRLTPYLAEGATVIDFDLPGFGKSEAAGLKTDIDGWADDVAELIRAFGYGRADVHGTSLGGMIGLSLAARHPDVVRRVVLSAFSARCDRAGIQMRTAWVRVAQRSGMAAVADLTAVTGFSRSFFERDDARREVALMRRAFSHTPPANFIRATRRLWQLDLTPFAARVEASVLLLGGADDNITPVDPPPSGVGIHQLAKLMPAAELVVLPNCGHYIVMERPAEVANEIARFLGATT